MLELRTNDLTRINDVVLYMLELRPGDLTRTNDVILYESFLHSTFQLLTDKGLNRRERMFFGSF